MPNIHANIIAVRDRIIGEGAGSTTGNRLKLKALAAINGGAQARLEYMSEFATTTGDLARLIGTDGTHANVGMNDARAYLIANAPCGTDTVTRLDKGVTNNLD